MPSMVRTLWQNGGTLSHCLHPAWLSPGMLLEALDASLSEAAQGRPLYFKAKPPALLSAVPHEMPRDNSPLWCGSEPRLCCE